MIRSRFEFSDTRLQVVSPGIDCYIVWHLCQQWWILALPDWWFGETALGTFHFFFDLTNMSATYCWTRGRQQQLIAEKLDVSVLNATQRDLIVPLIFEQISRPEVTKAELLRFIFLTPELSAFRELSNADLATFVRCSEGNVSRVLRDLSTNPSPTVAVSHGRPTILTRESEAAILDWLKERISSMDWPTIGAFKDVVWRLLEKEVPNFVPTHQFFYDLLGRLSDGELTVRSASGLDDQRYAVTPDIISEHFETLNSLEIQVVHPRLVINIDETGFGQSASGRTKPQKVIVPSSFSGSPVYKASEEKRYVTCIAATTLVGELLRPGLISNRRQEAEDATKCSFFSNCVRYHSTTAFISADIFLHYMRHVILEYVEKQREILGQDSRCIILFDGHKGHVSRVLRAFCADANIQLVLLPPHSSHLLQPLDQLIFRRMKREFTQMAPIRGLTKSSGMLERVWASYQASNVTWIVWRSWECAGVAPIVEEGVCTSCTLNPAVVLEDSVLQHEFKPNERSRGRQVLRAEYGLLNEDEFMMLEAGQCPLCYHPLEDNIPNMPQGNDQ